jgi:acetyl-CoA synthetase
MSDAKDPELSALLHEDRIFEPPAEFRAKAIVKDATAYEEAERDPEGFWGRFASELEWSRKWTSVLDWSNPPHAKWFVGGQINVSVNCVDRHIGSARRNKAALIWEGDPGDRRTLTYYDLYRQVSAFANVLKSLGVKKGDRVAIYMPLVPELAIAMLACARIGAPHSIVFGGFSADSLRDRMNDAQCTLLITADGGYRRGAIVPLKKVAYEALDGAPSVKNLIMLKRLAAPDAAKSADLTSNSEARVHDWHELMAKAPLECPAEPMDSEDLLYVLYTSGTTGKPKGIMHTTGGYLTGVYATTKWVFDLKEDDVYWCTADIGWVTGHSYVVYGPLANGATVVMYEGAPDFPQKDRLWEIVERYGVTIFYTAPTAIRAFMKWGPDWPKRRNMSSLRLLGSVGEPINPEAWIWYHTFIGGGRCPIVDTWWQTETGMIMITPLPGVTPLKPGSATKPFPGIKAEIRSQSGDAVNVGGGLLALTRPWPAMLRGIYGDPERFVTQYWRKWDRATYFTGDGAKRDEDGYFWVLGRVDDVINVAGHRIGTMEVESALVDLPKVAEAAVVGRTHELKEHVVKKIGSIARPEDILFVADVPKTRSGKIMRRLLKDIAEGKALGDTTTLADPAVVAKLKAEYEEAG